MTRISPRAIKLWRIRALINSGIWLVISLALGIGSIFIDFIPWWSLLIPLAVVFYILLVSVWIMPKLRCKYFTYEV